MYPSIIEGVIHKLTWFGVDIWEVMCYMKERKNKIKVHSTIMYFPQRDIILGFITIYRIIFIFPSRIKWMLLIYYVYYFDFP